MRTESQVVATRDGVIRRAERIDEGAWRAIVEVRPEDAAWPRLVERRDEVIFSARSRIARLGIEVDPGPLTFEKGAVTFEARIFTTVRDYRVEPILQGLDLTGLPVGRLVLCPEEQRLSGEEILAELDAHGLQLPEGFSIGSDGHLVIRPRPVRYGLAAALDAETLQSIWLREDGRAALNRLQEPHSVPLLTVPPGEGLIASCGMFLHHHYVVLDRAPAGTARHLSAVALDPVTTRGSRIYLEFYNPTEAVIVNPFATARVYRAPTRATSDRTGLSYRWLAPATPEPAPDEAIPVPEGTDVYATAAALRAAVDVQADRHYLDRPGALLDAAGTLTRLTPRAPAGEDGAWTPRARGDEVSVLGHAKAFATSRLVEVPDGAGATLVLHTFPSFIEHMHVCQAALRGAVQRLVFRRASYEHGPFLSARDHGRLADYQTLGVDVFWANGERGHLARHVYRGSRGYFVTPEAEQRFRNALIIAFYGSARPLDPADRQNLEELVITFQQLFGPEVAVMTGGGPGAMSQVTEIAQSMGLLAGASFIETTDQETNKTADFYQTFQGNSRHFRQRWFEVSTFQVFCIGGVGTLEEVGLTLTDMKLGQIERGPIAFFGRGADGAYWQRQKEQIERMIEVGRAPAWFREVLLFTNSPEEVATHFRKLLGIH